MKHAEPRPLELLAPARDLQVGRAAIMHGADAVYIGASAFGARASAGNSVEDIAELCRFAHQFRAKVYTTVNTIVYERELEAVRRLIDKLYQAGVDAIIVQDMALLRMQLPPIELHASTQCDTRTPEKAEFLQEAGFSQIVLARELTLPEIKAITERVKVPVEVFIHGALCVSYSGRCHASQALCGRSANRGECAQICRLPYTLTDANGKVLARDKHLLSLHDFNTTASLQQLVDAGASSFKIEGRLKDEAYVKNITAHYRRKLDEIIAANPDRYRRASCGTVNLNFTPSPQKSFNRGFTSYFLNERRPASIASIYTPKSLGEPMQNLDDLHNGDGLSFFTSRGEYTGFLVNGVRGGRPVPNKPIQIPKNASFFRTTDVAWDKTMSRTDTASRRISLKIKLFSNRIEGEDERGVRVVLPHSLQPEAARKPQNIRAYFEKLGDTIYSLADFELHLPADSFIPASALTALRRSLTEALDSAAVATYRRNLRAKENPEAKYPAEKLDYRDNVANSLADKFYRDHGVKQIEPAMETTAAPAKAGTVVMTTRHCVLRELGLCLRELKANGRELPKLPLTLRSSARNGSSGSTATLHVRPDCARCEMQITL